MTMAFELLVLSARLDDLSGWFLLLSLLHFASAISCTYAFSYPFLAFRDQVIVTVPDTRRQRGIRLGEASKGYCLS